MNVFRQLLEEAQGVWREMTSTQRVAVTTMVITVAALLAFVIYLGGTSREMGLMPLPLKIEASDAKTLIEKIESAGLGPAQYDLESKRLLVPLEKSRDAVILLAQENLLPKDQGTDFERMLDRWAFSDTRDKTEEMKRVARCNEVARLIERIDIVQEAKVIYSDTTPSALYRAPSRPRAAVVVKAKMGKVLDQKTAETIIALVAAAKANLDEKDVQVTDDKGRHFTVIDRDGLEAMGNIKWADEQRRNEFEQRKIENLIRAAVPGCEAYVFLDHKIDYTRRERHEVKYGEGTKVQTMKDKRELRTTKGPVAEPGARTNVVGTVEGGGEREETVEINSREEATIQPDKTETLEKPAPEVKALTIAAVVQMPYEYRKDEKGEWLVETDQEGKPLLDEHGRPVRKKFSANVEDFIKNKKEQLERQIRMAAGMLPGAQNMEVDILAVPYPESHEFPALPPPAYYRFWEWFRDNVIPFIIIFVILLFGFFLYAQAKRALPHEEARIPEEEPLALIPEMSEMDKQQATFEAMRGNIAKAVAEDPRKAANLLRRWLKRDAYS